MFFLYFIYINPNKACWICSMNFLKLGIFIHNVLHCIELHTSTQPISQHCFHQNSVKYSPAQICDFIVSSAKKYYIVHTRPFCRAAWCGITHPLIQKKIKCSTFIKSVIVENWFHSSKYFQCLQSVCRGYINTQCS